MPKLSNNELAGGYNYKKVITHNDLTAAATTQTIQAIEIPQYAKVHDVTYYLETEFDGGATSELTIQVGDGTDPNGFIEAKSVHADATAVFSSQLDGAYASDGTTANVINSKYYATSDTLDVLFTSTGANVDALTAGKITFLANISDPVSYTEE